MMKRILHPVSITLIVVIGIFSLPLFLQKKIPVLTDAQLREAATNHNLHPVPKTYAGIMAVTQNPDNPSSETALL